MSSGYILGLSRGHNGGACLLKDGKIIFALEEERLSRLKYDGSPFACIKKVLEYTDKLDAIVICHTQPLEIAGSAEYTGDNIYIALARKFGLIERKVEDLRNHPQVIDISKQHHKAHAACAFYRSGFSEAASVVVDGAGTCRPAKFGNDNIFLWEVESIFDCSYDTGLKTLYKHYGCRDPINLSFNRNVDSSGISEEGTHTEIVSGHAGITKVYEAVTGHAGFEAIEAGKLMGLAPYGKPNNDLPKLFRYDTVIPISDRTVVIPTYPNSAIINFAMFKSLQADANSEDLTKDQNIRDLAYAAQIETQTMVLDLILTAAKLSKKNKVVLSGGYGLNCVANYSYLERLKEEGIELYVEPVSNDAGTAIGAALLYYYYNTNDSVPSLNREIYLGPEYNYTNSEIQNLAAKYNGTVKDVTHNDVVELMTEKNIVACFQGRSENGPRALGNRSLMFDPTFEDGKDFVNQVKRREYFRPFAGSILEEDAHEWFDLRGLESSPHMMYAVNANERYAEKIPSIIHVDGTCRIQTVNREENPHYYDIIKAFKEKTGIPIIFNTSFNLGGEPLVETLEDALWTLQQSDIEYLYLPEYNKLITIGNFKII